MTQPDAGTLIHEGRLAKDPSAKLDPVIYDSRTGKPIQYGNDDPNVIGADSHVDFHVRSDADYPDLPQAVKDAEVRFLLPMAKHIASRLGITVMDEISYEKTLDPIRSRFLFVVMNLKGVTISDGVASWIGVVLMCKRHPIATVQVKLKLSTGQIGIYRVKLWEKKGTRYLMHGDRTGNSFMSREETLALVLNYLNTEGVVPGI